MLHGLDASPELLSEEADLGEPVRLGDSAEIGVMSDYTATKKKYEGLVKKVEAGLRKKKAAAKKKFDSQMKKFHSVFSKLYAPIKSGPAPQLKSPLGSNGMGGMSSMARWAYSAQVGTWAKIAHKKIKRYETLLQENRYRHFSTAVCKEVLKKKNLDAIGDLQYNKKKASIRAQLKKQAGALKRKVMFDRADMQHKVASYKVWNKNTGFAIDGGVTGRDAKSAHLMNAGQTAKAADSKFGELVQAAHWAFARQKAHAIDFYARNVKLLKKRQQKAQLQHDLTLCRTGRRPNSPQLKFEMKMAKAKLKKQIKKMPAKAMVAAQKKKIAKKIAKSKAVKKGHKLYQSKDLGEGNVISGKPDGTIVDFHKLIVSSGGDETMTERAKMFESLEQQELLTNYKHGA